MPLPLILLLALAPALISWWTGRGILARVDDPALPEILLERRRRLGKITLAGAVILAVLAGSELLWALPLLWVALLVSGYPLRRTLFAERWSLPAFLHYAIASAIGQAGWRLLLLIGPLVTFMAAFGVDPDGGDAAKRIALWLGCSFGVLVLLGQRFYSRIWLDLHRATPLRTAGRPELIARLDAVLDRAALVRRPDIYRFGAPGGHFVNALAIPSRYAPAVALSDGLLAALSDDEIVAVFAHEVAHHEQFTRRRRVTSSIALVLALLMCGLPLGFMTFGPGFAALGALAACLALLVALGRRAPSRRDLETASDLRAAALTGTPDALASALTKVHVYNRVPRRWPHAAERAATHPSLARRIQALRTAVPAPLVAESTTPGPLVIVRSPRAGTVVALDPTRAHWFDGVPADAPLDPGALRGAASSYRALAYGDLVELRVGTIGNQRTLNAVDRRGHAWSVTIDAGDVSRVQTALDLIDVKLGARPAALQPAGMAMARLLAIAALIALAVSGEAGVVLVPILFVLFRPALTAAVAAAGAIALGRGIVALTSFAWMDVSRQICVAGGLAAAIALIVMTVMRARAGERRDVMRRPAREAWLLVLLLACLAVIFAAAVLPMGLARPASLAGNPLAISALTTLAGLGAAIGSMSGPWRRVSGTFTSAVSLAGALLLAGDGSLYNRSAALTWGAGRLESEQTVVLPGGSAGTLELSPSGDSYVVTQFRAGRRGTPAGNRYLVGRFGDSRAARMSDALQIAFLDDSTLLDIAMSDTDSLEVRTERVAPDSSGQVVVLWRQPLPSIEMPRLLLDRVRQRWVALGRGDDERDIVVATGGFAGEASRNYRWTSSAAPDFGEMTSQPLVAFADGSAIAETLGGLRDAASSFGPMMMLLTANPRWELRSDAADGERVLANLEGLPTCASEIDAGSAVCAERGANRVRLWRVRASSAEHVGDLPAVLNAVHPLGGGRVAAVERFGTRMAVVDLAAHHGTRLTLPVDGRGAADVRWTADVAAAAGYVAVLSTGRNTTMIRRYRAR